MNAAGRPTLKTFLGLTLAALVALELAAIPWARAEAISCPAVKGEAPAGWIVKDGRVPAPAGDVFDAVALEVSQGKTIRCFYRLRSQSAKSGHQLALEHEVNSFNPSCKRIGHTRAFCGSD